MALPARELARMPSQPTPANDGDFDAPLLMTSREIAELTGKRHDNVRRDINGMLTALALSPLSFEASYRDGTGRSLPMYRLPKRETMILVSGYSVVLRARIVDRWQELEGAEAKPTLDLENPAALRGLLLGYTEKVLALEGRVATLAPQADALHRLAGGAETTLCLRDTAKHLQLKPMAIYPWLEGISWIYRRKENAKWVAHQPQIDNGRLIHKLIEHNNARDGSTRQEAQVRVTQKGLARLAWLISKGKGPESKA